jgi:excisionase family DNA binding protein
VSAAGCLVRPGEVLDDQEPAAARGSGVVGRRLDAEGPDERASGEAKRRAGSLGGSNRLLSVAEVADYLGVPAKTVYACWRAWGLRGYRVGRHLRFRLRHLEEWLEGREV